MSERKFILTLSIAPEDERALTELRTRYFPPERNYLSAHITLFHALPEEKRQLWQADLDGLRVPQFPIKIGDPYSLGRGVAFRIESTELLRLRNILAKSWADFLSPQDRQGYRPHCTIQNKVSAQQAAATLEEVRGFQRSSIAQSLKLWEYLGGPWRADQNLTFKTGP